MLAARIGEELVRAATHDIAAVSEESSRDLEKVREGAAAELHELVAKREAYLCYAVAHANRGPLDPLTVSIGGDCYRRDQVDLAHVLDRSRDLARAMLRKSVVIFPDLPALHGGKKGEWIIVDENGRRIDGLSDLTVVALGALAIPQGIQFLNAQKTERLRTQGVAGRFPPENVIRPDTASPDVLSGAHWNRMVRTWQGRGHSLSYFSCAPPDLGGLSFPSSTPTGRGVATSAMRLAARYFPDRSPSSLRILVEALGGVSREVIEALIRDFGVPPTNISAFDPVPDLVRDCGSKGIRAVSATNADFYRKNLTDEYDVWINNGLGDDVLHEHVDALLNHGVRIFCGGANNFLALADRHRSLSSIFERGAVAWPDEAASGGGWTMAVLDLYKRCQRLPNGTNEQFEKEALGIISHRNSNLIDLVYDRAERSQETSIGEALWRGVDELVRRRVQKAREDEVLAPEDILRAADVSNWDLQHRRA
ncbi:MAG: hypothetical protein GY711_03730 [bacterium]|nr:hypothetical protein [bacterium]